jgi:hypothetical protein
LTFGYGWTEESKAILTQVIQENDKPVLDGILIPFQLQMEFTRLDTGDRILYVSNFLKPVKKFLFLFRAILLLLFEIKISCMTIIIILFIF